MIQLCRECKLPRSALLSADARTALGLDPEGSILVFDEAHNLLDAINGAHGSSLTGAQTWVCSWAAALRCQQSLMLKIVSCSICCDQAHSRLHSPAA